MDDADDPKQAAIAIVLDGGVESEPKLDHASAARAVVKTVEADSKHL